MAVSQWFLHNIRDIYTTVQRRTRRQVYKDLYIRSCLLLTVLCLYQLYGIINQSDRSLIVEARCLVYSVFESPAQRRLCAYLQSYHQFLQIHTINQHGPIEGKATHIIRYQLFLLYKKFPSSVGKAHIYDFIVCCEISQQHNNK